MQKLLSNAMVEKYLVKEIQYDNKKYTPIFRYIGKTLVDTHEVHVGFKRSDGTEEVGSIFLPSVRDDGLIQRNKLLWYPVNLVIPPLCFRYGKSSAKYYMSGILNNNIVANRLTDFLPEPRNISPVFTTPIIKDLTNKEGDDILDTGNWIVIDTACAVIELFNAKIVKDISRSNRGGWKGISASVKAIHSLIKSYVRYYGDSGEDNESSYNTERENTIVEEQEIHLGKIGVEDKSGVLVIHPLMKDIPLDSNTPIDFCTCSTSHPIVNARLKDGVEIENCKMIGTPSFPYATWRRAIPGILSDKPHRVIVSRSINRALKIEEPDEPLVVTDVLLNVDSVSLPGVRMSHPLNYEDGIVVSETMASKMGAFKVLSDVISVPESTDVLMIKKQFDYHEDIREAAKKATRISNDSYNSTFVLRPGDLIATIAYKDQEGKIVVKERRTRHRVPGIIMKIEEIQVATDLQESIDNIRIITLVYIPLQVGDKISDAHGNKCVVSAVYPDEDMPIWNGKNTHYIATPYIMSRMAVGAEIEDKLSTIAATIGIQVSIDSLDPPGLEEVDAEFAEYKENASGCENMEYTGSVLYNEEIYEDIPLSYRRMFRLDNNGAETLITRAGTRIENNKRVGKNTKLSLEIVTMLSRGAVNLANELVSKSGSSLYVKDHLVPTLNSVVDHVPEGASTIPITNRIPQEMIGNPLSLKVIADIELKNTPLDPRLKNSYGIVLYKQLYKNIQVVVPPHTPLTEIGNGLVLPGPIAVAINKVVAEIASEKAVRSMDISTAIYPPDVPAKIAGYKNDIARIITGKNGMMRKAVMPVFPHTIRAVASPYMDDKDNPFVVRIPRKAFRRLEKSSEEFADMYQRKDKWYCLMKRDPVHRSHNVLSVRFELWNRNTIGVSPNLIGAMDGDYDGDAVVVMFPTSSLGWTDLAKMSVPFEKLFSPSKQLTGVVANNAFREIRRRIGFASTFRNPHETDEVKDIEMINTLTGVPSMDKISSIAVTAARDFEMIKDGTAKVGALGLRFIYMRTAENADMLERAMEMYHLMAQDTLDSKSGEKRGADEIVEAFNKGSEAGIETGLKGIGFYSSECIEELKTLSKECRKRKGIRPYMLDHFPVLESIQSNAGLKVCSAIAKKIVSKDNLGKGTWETLLEYLTGRAEGILFERSINSFGDLAKAGSELKEKVGQA